MNFSNPLIVGFIINMLIIDLEKGFVHINSHNSINLGGIRTIDSEY